MKKRNLLNIMFLFVFSGAAQAECNSGQTGSGEVLGTLLGAAIGGLVGSQIGSGTGNKVAIGAGVLAGGMFGNRIGSQLDCQDQAYHVDTTQNALEYQPTGQTSTWKNPDSGHSGAVTPTKTYVVDDGKPCREFTQTIYVDGQAEEVQATACRQEDGTWQMMDS
ncbi:MAG: RT0821/Lpp0805 family surface protein [Gammaproteobacteria bacterium]|nr:RT0821/Lpp0805 family surface protein [Gammaproteobacteria bacterium]